MNTYIPTCNSRIYLIEALIYSLKKYWHDFENNKFTIVGYNSPKFDLPKNVMFESLGDDDTVENWAIDLKTYFDSIDDDYFVYMNDDAAIVYEMDIELFNLFLDIIKQNDNSKLGRICLTQDISNNSHSVIGEYDDFSLIQLNQDSQYRLSTQFSIWNREYLTKYMTENMTPWQFELQDTSKNDGWSILGTKNRYCLDFYHLWRIGGMSSTWNVGTHSGKNLSSVTEDYNFISSVLDKSDG